MIIDFHAHIYPNKIAEKASHAIGAFYNAPMSYNGSPEALIASGKRINVTKYVVHSAATSASQVESINNFIIAQASNHSEFIGFGTMHVDYENFSQELERIKNAGLKGIKLHPDFQKFPIDCEKMNPIYEKLIELGLICLVHAGDKRFDFSGPQHFKNVIDRYPDLVMIAAHFGGYTEWDKSYEILAGQKIYFDTSSSLWTLPVEKANAFIKKHGADRFVWGSDFPMWDHKEELERFNKLGLSDSDKEKILYSNAAKLLGL